MRTSQNYQQKTLNKRTIQKGKSSSNYQTGSFQSQVCRCAAHKTTKNIHGFLSPRDSLDFLTLGDFYCASYEVIKATILNLQYQLSQIVWGFSPVLGEINKWRCTITNQSISHQTSGFGNDLETFQVSKHDIICSNGEGKAPLLAFLHGLSTSHLQ